MSQLWGEIGELWDPLGRLPDYSYAGYHGGEAALPEVPVAANVTDFGALGDGVTNDVQAFRAAIAHVASQPDPGAVYVPPGTYRIGGILEIDDDDVVLRGAGPGATVLYFPNHLTSLTGTSSPWIHGEGGLIWVGDQTHSEPALGAKLSDVIVPQLRGDRELVLASASGISAGDYVVLELIDTGSRSLGTHLHNEQELPGTCTWQPLPVRWPVKVTAVNGNALTLAQPLRLDLRLEWQPSVYRYDPVREVGIEDMELRAPAHAYPGHLTEDGYNLLTFEGALDCWLDNVTFRNVDNGPSCTGLTKNCTMQSFVVLAGTDGHHGVSLRQGAADCLVQDFVIEPVFIHGVTFDHQPCGNVLRRGSGTNIALDHHRDGAYENLFSDMHVGAGSMVWVSGGSTCAGPRAGARNSYWNLTSGAWNAPPIPQWAYIQSNVFPAQYDHFTTDGEWLEAAASPTPADLYSAQLERRLDDEVLTKSKHVVATFEADSPGPLIQRQGAAPTYSNGAVVANSLALARFVDLAHLWDDQDIVFEVAPNLPRGGRVGVLLRAPNPDVTPANGTQVYVRREDTPVGSNDAVKLHIRDENGLALTSSAIWFDPTQPLVVRVGLHGNHVQAQVEALSPVSYTGVGDPAGGGYTSFFVAEPASGSGAGEQVGLNHAEIVTGSETPDVYLDANGTLWLTLYDANPGSAPFGANAMVHYNEHSWRAKYFAEIFRDWSVGYELDGPYHATIGYNFDLSPGDRIWITDGGVTDEIFVPWW